MKFATVATTMLASSFSTTFADPTWSVAEYNWDTIILGLAFSDENNGFVPYGDNGSGDGVHVTADGGATWQHGQQTQYSSLLMDAAASSNIGVMGGSFDTQYSSDRGMTFNVSQGVKFVSQSMEPCRSDADGKLFGATGSSLGQGGNGVAWTKDSGKTWSFFNISNAKTLARYGAFPTPTTWFVTLGEWPQQEDLPATVVAEKTARLQYHEIDGKKKFKYVDGAPARLGARREGRGLRSPGPSGFVGQLMKTTDGGATWTEQFYTEDFYFNQVDCFDETHCCAAGESDAGDKPGARIVCTTDGTTWTQNYYEADADASLLAMRALSADEYWGGGGILESAHFQGAFPHSTDGGKTWANSTLMKVYGTDLQFPSEAVGFAATLDRDELSGLAKYA